MSAGEEGRSAEPGKNGARGLPWEGPGSVLPASARLGTPALALMGHSVRCRSARAGSMGAAHLGGTQGTPELLVVG